jgi:hypothetical protein
MFNELEAQVIFKSNIYSHLKIQWLKYAEL